MKRFTVMLLCVALLLMPCFAAESKNNVENSAVAETSAKKTSEKTKMTNESEKDTEKEEEKSDSIKYEVQDNSQPRLMVTGYSVEGGYLTPDKDGKITVTLKNMHSSKTVKNIKLSVGDETDEIRPDGMGTKYVTSIGAGKTYIWEIDVKAIHSATVGEHRLNFVCDYEDANGGSYSSNDVLRAEIRQPAELDFDGAKLPVKVVQDDTVTVDINLMNTGKTALYNCKVAFEIDGLESGGVGFAGEIPIGESKSVTANLLVDSEKIGKAEGKIKITYEDSFGEEYEQVQEVKTVIEKKIVKAVKNEEEEKSKNPLWWLFLSGGFVAGGGIGFGIPFALNAKKQREEDEKRL